MLFIVFSPDRPGMLEKRLAERPKHVEYWDAMPGVVKLAGAMLDQDNADGKPKGSAFILEAESEKAVRALLAGDPFTTESIFSGEYRIEPLRPGIGEWKSLALGG